MKQAVNCAVKADRAIRCPICQRGRLLNAAEHTDLRSLRLFRPEQADGVTGECIVADSGMMRNIMAFQPAIDQYPPAGSKSGLQSARLK